MAPLTWLELAESDDYLCRNLIDSVHYWITTRKVNKGFQVPLTINQKVLVRLLTKYVIHSQTPNIRKCLEKFMKHQTTKEFLSRYGDTQRLEFKKHARKYIELYHPDCGFEIDATDRYQEKSGSLEGCIIARKPYSKGDEIKYLEGTLALLDSKGEAVLSKNDFSVFNTSSGQTSKLMLGPCRFVNHDCSPNTEFLPTMNGLKLMAVKDIIPGQEITVMYSESYFGKGNRDCLCATCERLGTGFYNPDRKIPDEKLIDVSSSDEGEEKGSEVIMIDTKEDQAPSEEEDRETDDFSSSDVVSDSSASPVLLDPEDYFNDAAVQSRILASKLKQQMSVHSDKPFIEPEGQIVGGRKLRKRKIIDYSRRGSAIDTILNHYKLDQSLDTCTLKNEHELKARQVNRTLHKMFMINPYNETRMNMIYDCLACGVYFMVDEVQKYLSYCPRCVRHLILYGSSWPDTKATNDIESLEMFEGNQRISIGEYLERFGSSQNSRGTIHAGIVLPSTTMKDSNQSEIKLKTVSKFKLELNTKTDKSKTRPDRFARLKSAENEINLSKEMNYDLKIEKNKTTSASSESSSGIDQLDELDNIIQRSPSKKLKKRYSSDRQRMNDSAPKDKESLSKEGYHLSADRLRMNRSLAATEFFNSSIAYPRLEESVKDQEELSLRTNHHINSSIGFGKLINTPIFPSNSIVRSNFALKSSKMKMKLDSFESTISANPQSNPPNGTSFYANETHYYNGIPLLPTIHYSHKLHHDGISSHKKRSFGPLPARIIETYEPSKLNQEHSEENSSHQQEGSQTKDEQDNDIAKEINDQSLDPFEYQYKDGKSSEVDGENEPSMPLVSSHSSSSLKHEHPSKYQMLKQYLSLNHQNKRLDLDLHKSRATVLNEYISKFSNNINTVTQRQRLKERKIIIPKDVEIIDLTSD